MLRSREDYPVNKERDMKEFFYSTTSKDDFYSFDDYIEMQENVLLFFGGCTIS
jgi:hypothetical protein